MVSPFQGFKDFFLTEWEIQSVPEGEGLAEINRLAKTHYMLIQVADHGTAWKTMKGSFQPQNSKVVAVTDVQKMLERLTPQMDSIIFAFVPKRWAKKLKLGRDVNVHQLVADIMPNSGLPVNHIWGMYSKWNPNFDEHDGGNFYRNSSYHAHDKLLDAYTAKLPPRPEKPAKPLSQQPKLPTAYTIPQGRHSFHGYATSDSEVEKTRPQ